MISRYKLILLGMFVFAILIVAKLAKTTIVDASAWNKLAQKSLVDSIVMYPERGNILSADGSLLAATVVNYDVFIDLGAESLKADTLKKYVEHLCDTVCIIDPSQKPGKLKEKILDKLDAYTAYAKAKAQKVEGLKNPGRNAVLLTNCPYSDYLRLRSMKFFRRNGLRYSLGKSENKQRIKPFGLMAERCIGSVRDSMINRQSVLFGKTGLEKELDSLLFGKPGIGGSILLTNGVHRWAEIAPQRGYDIVTTIDVKIQDLVETELINRCIETGADWGTVVLMEVNTGEIKAISNVEMKNGKYVESVNYAFRGFEPGSVIKPISMMIALEDNLVGLGEKIPTGRSFAYAGGRPISDSHAYTSLTPKEVITYSSNIGMSKIILRGFEKNPAKFRQRLEEIGMLEPLHLGIYGETTPYIPHLGNKNWDRINLTRMCYGYGTRIPPIYTLALYNAIANDGKFVRPRLVKELWKNGECDTVFPISYVRDRICRPEVAAEVRDMLRSVVEDPHGTGKSLKNNFVAIAGKTGTAYYYDPKIKGYDLSKKRMAFCGYFPADKPKYSCVVLMYGPDRGAGGSSGRVLLNVALKLYARGLLGNVSDYRTEADNRNTPVTLFAMDNSMATTLKSDIGVQNARRLKKPQQGKGVPSVIGMGIRDALATLEDAGLNVAGFEGSGYVYSQSIKPGEKYWKGQRITLKLKER